MKRYIQLYENWQREEIIKLSSGRDKIILTIHHGKIESVDSNTDIDFPFVKGHPVQLPFIKAWANRHSFRTEVSGDTHSNKKIFGINTKDIPSGHPLRLIRPGLFRD